MKQAANNFTFATHDKRSSRVVLPTPGIHLVNPPRQLKFFFAEEEIDEAALESKLAAGQESARQCASSTHRAYQADWSDFLSFCRKTGRDSLPALPRTVSLYLMWLESAGKAAATLTRRLAAITSEHRRAGHPTPCNGEVGQALASIRRRLGTAPKPKAPVEPRDLKIMLAGMPDTSRGLRDAAILAVGFASGCRRSELAALGLVDISILPQGLVVRIARSKTDQQGKGREVGVHRGGEICPVKLLESWLHARGDWPGPLFCRIKGTFITHDALAPAAIGAVVKAAVKRAFLDPALYAGHSLRSGCATAAAAAGADILAIARRLGHASTRTTERYIRHGSLFATNPLKGVL